MTSLELAIELCAHYIDKAGLISPYYHEKIPQQASGNGLFYTAIYRLLLQYTDELSEEHDDEHIRIIKSCESYSGTYNRSPTNKIDGEGPDDYVAVIYMLDSISDGVNRFAARRSILWRGEENKTPLRGILNERTPRLAPIFNFLFGWIKVRWNYNNVKYWECSNSSWFGRFPHLVASIKMINFKKPTLFEVIWWNLSLATAGKQDSADGWIQAIMLKEVGGHKMRTGWCGVMGQLMYPICWTIFRNRFDKRYPSLAACIAHEFGPHKLRPYGHPLTTYAIANREKMEAEWTT